MNADSVEYIISFIFTVAMLACLTCIACRLTDILHAIRNLHNFSVIPRNIDVFITRKDEDNDES